MNSENILSNAGVPDNTTVFGHTTNDDISALYLAADAYLTTNREVLSTSDVELLEAALCRLSAYTNGLVDKNGNEIGFSNIEIIKPSEDSDSAHLEQLAAFIRQTEDAICDLTEDNTKIEWRKYEVHVMFNGKVFVLDPCAGTYAALESLVKTALSEL